MDSEFVVVTPIPFLDNMIWLFWFCNFSQFFICTPCKIGDPSRPDHHQSSQSNGLPNAISCNQDMDDWYQDFKDKMDVQAQDIFNMKTYEYTDGETELKSAALTNNDIPIIINGEPDDLVKQPFLCCTTPEKIFKSWMVVGFVPFTQNALSHKKVHHMLGEGGASVEMSAKVKETQQNYNCLKREVIILCISLCC